MSKIFSYISSLFKIFTFIILCPALFWATVIIIIQSMEFNKKEATINGINK